MKRSTKHPRRTERARNGTPENERPGVQLKLRVTAEIAERFRNLAKTRGIEYGKLLEELLASIPA